MGWSIRQSPLLVDAAALSPDFDSLFSESEEPESEDFDSPAPSEEPPPGPPPFFLP
jgi:hypothetical protein